MAKKCTKSVGRGRKHKITQATRRRNAATRARREAKARARSMRRRQTIRAMLAAAAAEEVLQRKWEAEDELRRELEAYPFEWHKRQSFY